MAPVCDLQNSDTATMRHFRVGRKLELDMGAVSEMMSSERPMKLQKIVSDAKSDIAYPKTPAHVKNPFPTSILVITSKAHCRNFPAGPIPGV